MQQSEYGPRVDCTTSRDIEQTWRPAKAGGPWFCMLCGATNHKNHQPPRGLR